MNHKLHEILACPLCQNQLKYDKKEQLLICHFDKLAFPIKNEIPVMLVSEARHFVDDPDASDIETIDQNRTKIDKE